MHVNINSFFFSTKSITYSVNQTLFWYLLLLLILFLLLLLRLFVRVERVETVTFVKAPAGSSSCGGDVTVFVLDINQPSLPTPF